MKPFTVRYCICILAFLSGTLTSPSFAVNDNYPSGARASGLSNAGVTLIDLWSNYHNQAGLAFFKNLSFGFHYENKYVLEQYSQQSFALAIPTNSGTIGASFTFFGFSKYNETKISLAFGKPFGEKFAAGIQLNMLNVYQAYDYGNVMTLAVEGGILVKPVEKLLIGAHVFNPTGASYKQLIEEKVPVIFEIGLGYQMNEKLFFVTETEKKLESKTVIKAGAEYKVLKSVIARIGISTFKYSSYSFGVGFMYKKIRADMAFSHHMILGYTPHISMSYSF